MGVSLPSSWATIRLKYATSHLGRGIAPDYVDAGEVCVVGQAAIRHGRIDWARTRFHAHTGDASDLKGLLEPDDLVINSTGTGTLGRVAYHYAQPMNGPILVDGHITIARTNPSILNPRFAFYWLTSQPFQQHVTPALTVGATNQIELNSERLGNSFAPAPPVQLQAQIVKYLDAEIGRIDLLVRLYEAVNTRLDERDRALRDHSIDRLRALAGEIPLRRIANKIEQGASPQCDASSRTSSQQWAVLKLSAVKRGRFESGENKLLPSESTPLPEHEVRAGDLLVTRANTPSLVGDVAVANGETNRLLLPDLIYRVRMGTDNRAGYIAQVALSSKVRKIIESTARGTSQSMVKLRGEDIKAWPVPRATLAQQEQLEAELRRGMNTTESLRQRVSQQITVLIERRTALITAAVTGQFDVSAASGRGVTE